MKQAIANVWCQALRSNEFVQGYGFLDKNGKVCPLGILSQLALTVGACDVTETPKGYAYDKELGRIPESVKEWAGMYGQSGEIKGEFVNLTFYNDRLNFTLPEIADIIEEHWEDL